MKYTYTGFYNRLRTFHKEPDSWFLKTQKINDNENITADTYLNGACGIFALALQSLSGYPLFTIGEKVPIHVFCMDRDTFIDVRGRTNDFKLFIRPFSNPEIFDPWEIKDIFPITRDKIFQEYRTFYKNSYYTLEHTARYFIRLAKPGIYIIDTKLE